MIARIDRLRDQLRVPCQSRMAALFGKSCGFTAQYNGNLVFDIDSRIVVITELLRRCPVSDKYQRSIHQAGGRKAEGNELQVQLEVPLLRALFDGDSVVRSEPRAGDHREGLKIRL